jgi:hypothetical protein
MPLLFSIVLMLGFLLLIRLCWRNIRKQPVKLLLLCVLLALLPLACNIVFVMTAAEPHEIMLHAIVLGPVFIIVLADRCDESLIDNQAEESVSNNRQKTFSLVHISSWIISAVFALNVFNSFIVANQAYFKNEFAYETTSAQFAELISRIQNTEGYTTETQIIMVGNPVVTNGISYIGGPFLNGNYYSLFGFYAFQDFPKLHMGFTQPLEWIRSGVFTNTDLHNIIAAMPKYPDDGSVAMIGGTIFIKFAYPN